MPAFGMDLSIKERDSGPLKGRIYPIACKTWFTAAGKAMPLSFKFQGDDGEVRRVGELRILWEEEKNYAGVPSREYGCQAVVGGLLREIRLVFYVETCRWIMVIQG